MADAKGVMLAQRPADAAGGQIAGVFRPAGASESGDPWGICPIKKVSLGIVAPKPPGINATHRKWVRQLQEEVNAQKQADEDRAALEASKQQSLADFSAKLRSAILTAEDTSFWKATQTQAAAAAKHSLQRTAAASPKGSSQGSPAAAPKPAAPAAKPAGKEASPAPDALEGLEEFVAAVYNEATGKAGAATAPAPPQASSSTDQAGKAAAAPSASGSAAKGGEPSGAPEPASASTAKAVPDAAAKAPEASTASPRGAAAAPDAGAERPTTSQSQAKAGKAKGGKAGSSKPAWALSPAEAAQQEAAEEEELLSFTEQLDFDAFMEQLDDMELKETFQALQEVDKEGGNEKAWRRSFVQAVNHATNKRVQQEKLAAEDNDDCASMAGRSVVSSRMRTRSALLSVLGKQQDQWETSTRAGRDDGVAPEAAAAAEEILADNPDMKAVHSAASVRALLGSVQAKEAAKDKDKA